jgi:multiple sugar transport system permease protein
MDGGTAVSAATPAAANGRKRRMSRLRLREAIDGYICIAPWVLGFIIFTAFPIVASFVLSFSRYTILDPPRFVGLDNYTKMVSGDPLFWQSLKVTVIYTILLVPLGTVGGYLLALLLNQAVKGLSFFRTVFYLPVVTPAIATSYLFAWMLNPEIGLVNNFLAGIDIQGPPWFTSREWVIPSFIIMSLWGLGGNMILYLAGLQGVPTVLYEAAMLDGAGAWAKFRNVTLPMLTPTIFFNMVLGIIGALRVFAAAYVATEGGPAYSTWFYALHIYTRAFQYFEMGYASALAWIFFFVLFVFTYVQFRQSRRWVYYAGEVD